MKKNLVAIIALFAITTLVVSSSEARRYKRMNPDTCPVTGAHLNRVLDIIEDMQKEIAELKKRGKHRLAKKLAIHVENKKVQVYLARIKFLEARIAKLKAALKRLKASKMEPVAKKAAIKALEDEIAKLEKELKALKAKMALLPIRATTRPVKDLAGLQALIKELSGLTAAIGRLNKILQKGLRVPMLEKKIDKLLLAHKVTQNSLTDLAAAMAGLRQDLKKGIKVKVDVNRGKSWPKGKVPNWVYWHFTAGIMVGHTVLSGAPEHANPLMGEACGEYIHPSHIGVEGCLKLGGLFTKARDDTGAFHHLRTFVFGGTLSGAARWKYFGINIPKVEVLYAQNPIAGEKGLLWVNIYGGIAVIPHKYFLVGMDIGTSLHSDAAFLGGLQMRWYMRFRY